MVLEETGDGGGPRSEMTELEAELALLGAITNLDEIPAAAV